MVLMLCREGFCLRDLIVKGFCKQSWVEKKEPYQVGLVSYTVAADAPWIFDGASAWTIAKAEVTEVLGGTGRERHRGLGSRLMVAFAAWDRFPLCCFRSW